MKKIFMLIGICALFFSVTVAFADDLRPGVKTGNLTVAVDGFKNDYGFAKMALANSIEGYKDDAKSFMSKNVQIVNGKAVHGFNNVPFGEYAVKVYHDENGNDRLDKSILGAPLELYGFSNNVRGIIGRPDYKRAAFILNKPEMTITIHVE
jgi:uncharacterized protein (DUF2141 family)